MFSDKDNQLVDGGLDCWNTARDIRSAFSLWGYICFLDIKILVLSVFGMKVSLKDIANVCLF